ncbi:hypothetical protein EDD15DRAFT_2300981 [Pisolithus albus]|nr:hypothetical protein EDD15DRAFT_2300981 [Pisolithus albus]
MSLSPYSLHSLLHHTQSRNFPMDNQDNPCDYPWIEDDDATCQVLPAYWSMVGGIIAGIVLLYLLVLAVILRSHFPNIWSSLASFFRRRGRGSLPDERSVGMSCQPPQPTTQMCVFPDSVPTQDILPIDNDFGAPPHYSGYEYLSSHKDLRAPPPSYQGEINSNL